jgi:hypothetical protein
MVTESSDNVLPAGVCFCFWERQQVALLRPLWAKAVSENGPAGRGAVLLCVLCHRFITFVFTVIYTVSRNTGTVSIFYPIV